MKHFKSFLVILTSILFLSSCAVPTYLSPEIKKSYLVNTGTFSIQNMDQTGQIEPQSLTTHYEGFDVRYKVSNDFLITIEIVNNTNKSLIIDKSKCYVLYSGYSRELFKDVRSSRSTTFNNVQDAINNVQTSDASVSMTIPPYSKWELPIAESNVKNIENLPTFIDQIGIHPIQSYDNPEPVEFVIPYTFDYALGKWNTARNRVFVGQVEVSTQTGFVLSSPSVSSPNSYVIGKEIVDVTTNIDRINQQNIKMWKSHRHKVNASRIVWGVLTIYPLLGGGGWIPAIVDKCNESHRPVIYNSDGTSNGYYNKKTNYKSEY